MDYNKNGKADRYFNLDDILKLNLPDNIRKEVEEKFKKKVFYDNNGSCKLGVLIGVEMDYNLSETYYIIDIDGNKNYVPTWKSITRV